MSNFNFYNPNPKQRYKKTGEPMSWSKGDCVIRAFCGATGLGWKEVYKLACAIGERVCDMPNSDTVVSELAKRLGFERKSLPNYITVEAFAKFYNRKVCVCRVRNHVVCTKGGAIYDTWNCGSYNMKTYYELVDKDAANMYKSSMFPF